MPNVSHLLSTPLDDPSLDIPLCPVGTWRGELIKIAYRDEDSNGDPLADKNGDEYAMVRLVCRPETPTEDVDKKEAKAWTDAGGPEETVLSNALFVRGRRSVSRINKLLASLGVPVSGRSIKDVSEEYKGGVPCYFEVEHGEDNTGEPREQISAVYPLD